MSANSAISPQSHRGVRDKFHCLPPPSQPSSRCHRKSLCLIIVFTFFISPHTNTHQRSWQPTNRNQQQQQQSVATSKTLARQSIGHRGKVIVPFSSEVHRKRKAGSASGHPFMQNNTHSSYVIHWWIECHHRQTDRQTESSAFSQYSDINHHQLLLDLSQWWSEQDEDDDHPTATAAPPSCDEFWFR